MTDRGGTRTWPSAWTGEYQGEAWWSMAKDKKFTHEPSLSVRKTGKEGTGVGGGEQERGKERERRKERERGERRQREGEGKGGREREREREWTHILALHGASLEDGVARALRAAEGGIISDGLATDEAG